jgi:hypothetical protein
MGRLVIVLTVAAVGVGCTPPTSPRQAPPDIGRRDAAAAIRCTDAGRAVRPPYAAPSPSSRARAIAFTWISSVPA